MSTTFPNATQSFKTWQDLSSTQLTAYLNYLNALNNKDWQTARNIFTTNQLSYNMLPTANDFNTMCDTILECRRLYEAPTTSAQGIQDFMAQFTYRGEWNSSDINQYKKFSIVKYNSQIGMYLYIANTDVITTTDPFTNSKTSSPQWLRLCPVSWTNTASNFRGMYDSEVQYYTGDVVVNDSLLQVATVNGFDVTWVTLFDFSMISAKYTATQPSVMPDGGIWFKKIQ